MSDMAPAPRGPMIADLVEPEDLFAVSSALREIVRTIDVFADHMETLRIRVRDLESKIAHTRVVCSWCRCVIPTPQALNAESVKFTDLCEECRAKP